MSAAPVQNYYIDPKYNSSAASGNCTVNPVQNANSPVPNYANTAGDSVSLSDTDAVASLKSALKETKSKQGLIGNLWDGFKNLTHIGAGSNKAEKAIEKFKKGEISEQEALKAVDGYRKGQEMCVDVVADMASGILAVGAFALAVPTGGASLVVGLGAATAVGAGVKVGIKAGDAALTGKKYGVKDLLHDTVTGAINGLLAPVTNGIGASLTKTVGKKLGLTIVKEGAEEVIEQGVKQTLTQSFKSMVINQTTDVAGGTMAKRALALGAGMAADGALGGASDNMVRAALNGENVLEAGVQGAIGGLIMAPVIGGGMRMAAKGGARLSSTVFSKNATENTAAVSTACLALGSGAVAKNAVDSAADSVTDSIDTNAIARSAADTVTDSVSENNTISREAVKTARLELSATGDNVGTELKGRKVDLPNGPGGEGEAGFKGTNAQTEQPANSIQKIKELKLQDGTPRFSSDEAVLLSSLSPQEYRKAISLDINIKANGEQLNAFELALYAKLPQAESEIFANALSIKVVNGEISFEKALALAAYPPQQLNITLRHINKTNGFELNVGEIDYLANIMNKGVDSEFLKAAPIEIGNMKISGTDATYIRLMSKNQIDVANNRHLFDGNFGGRKLNARDIMYLSQVTDSNWGNIPKRNLLNSKHTCDNIAWLASMSDESWQKTIERKLLDADFPRKLNAREATTYATLSEEKWQNIFTKKLFETEFSNTDIIPLALMPDEAWQKAADRKLLETFYTKKLNGNDIRFLASMSDENWQKAMSRDVFATFKTGRFGAQDAGRLALLSDEQCRNIIQRNLIQGKFNSRLLQFGEIYELSQLNQTQWSNLKTRSRGKFSIFENCALARLDDANYAKASEFLKIRTENGIRTKVTSIENLLTFDLNKSSFAEKNRMLGTLDFLQGNFKPEQIKVLGVDVGEMRSGILKSLKNTITPMEITPESRRNFGKYFMANNNLEVENLIKTADIERFAKNGIPLEYSRNSFLQDFNNLLLGLSEAEKAQIFKKLEINPKLDENGLMTSWEGILALKNLDATNAGEKEVQGIIRKFTYDNKIVSGDADLDRTLNSLIEGIPEFTNVIGKAQHDTHAYSVDVHILKVLKEAMSNPEYANLSNLDKTVLKYSIVLHDLAKIGGEIDKDHNLVSALYARNIMDKFNPPDQVKDRVYEMVKNHHWLEDFNKNTATPQNIATRFRRPEDYSIAKIMAEADLKGVNDDWFREYGSALDFYRQSPVGDALSDIYKSGIVATSTKPIFDSKIPVVELDGKNYKVINFAQMSKDYNLDNVGFCGVNNVDDLRFFVHMLPDETLIKSAETTELLADIANEGFLSVSALSLENKGTYRGLKYGFVLDIDNDNIATAYNSNIGSGYGKNFDTFVNHMNNNNSPQRVFVRDKLVEALSGKYGELTESEYGALFKQLSNKKYLTQIKDELFYNAGNKSILGKDLKNAILFAQDQLFKNGATPHNELEIFSPKISAIICKESSLENVPKDFLNYAYERNLPVYLIGN